MIQTLSGNRTATSANPRSLDLQRNVPARGFKPFYYMVGMHMVMAYGFYKYFHGVREQRYVLRNDGGSQLR